MIVNLSEVKLWMPWLSLINYDNFDVFNYTVKVFSRSEARESFKLMQIADSKTARIWSKTSFRVVFRVCNS